MKKVRRLLAVLCCIGCFFAMATAASAQELAEGTSLYQADPVGTIVYGDYLSENTKADGLISGYSLYIKKETNNQVTVKAVTNGYTTMQSIGFKYITVQRYENGVWRDYWRQGDVYLTDSMGYTAYKTVSVATGYQYRAVVDHYAEKSGWWIFADSQTIHNDTQPLYM